MLYGDKARAVEAEYMLLVFLKTYCEKEIVLNVKFVVENLQIANKCPQRKNRVRKCSFRRESAFFKGSLGTLEKFQLIFEVSWGI